MHVEFVLIFIVVSYLRKKLQTKTQLPVWDKIFLVIFGVSILLWISQFSLKKYEDITMWLGHVMVLGLVYIILARKELRPAKSIIYAILPFIIVSLSADLTEAFRPRLYDEWVDYFNAAALFALVWLICMRIMHSRQNKALEKERLRTLEIEKENKLTEKLRAALEIEVVERTSELTKQKEELQHALNELKSTQTLLIQSEKMASLGELTAGIAHEIQNPLNFVNNFSEVNTELIEEMTAEIEKGNFDEVKAIAHDIAQNEQKINHHGKRADAIVKGMLQHSRSSSGLKEPSNLNEIMDEYFRLAYHGLRAKDKSFNASMKSDFDEQIGLINIIPQDIGRVILNLFTNAFYSVSEKKKMMATESLTQNKYEPLVSIRTKKLNGMVEIVVTDNGNGIPQKVIDKIFQPFFTTKPTGEGTGLGLSLSYDIIKAHGGEFKVHSNEGEGAEFIIHLPI